MDTNKYIRPICTDEQWEEFVDECVLEVRLAQEKAVIEADEMQASIDLFFGQPGYSYDDLRVAVANMSLLE